LELVVKGYTAKECDSDAEPDEFHEVLNGDPTFVEASFLNTGKIQFDLDDVAMFLWQSQVMENSHLFAIRHQDGSLAAVLTLLIPHPRRKQPWIGALIVHPELSFDVVSIPLLEGLEHRLSEDGWDSIYVNPMQSQNEVIRHWLSCGFEFVETRSDNNMRDVQVLRKSLKS